MREFMAITKALADTSRVRTLMLLVPGELCVCQIINVLGLAPSTVSKHMTILYQARLVEARKEGRWIYYRLSDGGSPMHQKALRWLNNALADNEQIQKDVAKLKLSLEVSADKSDSTGSTCTSLATKERSNARRPNQKNRSARVCQSC